MAIEILPDRTGETLRKWLADHPGVEVLCRDGSTAYAGGATAGDPDAATLRPDQGLLAEGVSRAVGLDP